MIVAACRGVAGRVTNRNLPRLASLTWPSVPTETETKQLWVCTSCGFIYDPEDGDPDGGIPPGTPFDHIPDTWFCPVCGARKADFEPYED
jgi:rubredoxin